jgi:hypothetical protein
MCCANRAHNAGTRLEDAALVHALSNHLSVILGFVEIVIADTPVDDPRRRDLIEIRDAALAAAAALIGRGGPPKTGK